MLILHEREAAIILSVLLTAFNLANLYFIIDLLSYDEMVGYRNDGGIKYSDPHNFVFVLLITSLLNLLFMFASLLGWLAKKH